MKSQKQLESFSVFCKQNPDLRFWQALSQWSGASAIIWTNRLPTDLPLDRDIKDTFYWENKTE